MSAEQLDEILANFGTMAGAWTEDTSLEEMRKDFEEFFAAYPMAKGTQVDTAHLGAPCEIVSTPGADNRRSIVLLHGGGFSMGSARAHRSYASHLSAASSAAVYSVDYRLAPEHLFPTAHEDAFTVYQHLLSEGRDSSHISICGDSAGAALAMGILIKARETDLPMPSRCILVSPWADMTCGGASYTENASIDPISNKDMALGMGAGYLGEKGNAEDPLASPVKADMNGFPPMLILAGEREIFLDDARAIAVSMRACNGQATLNIARGMIHQWPLHAGRLDEADEAIKEIGAFANANWAD